ncbi:antibiotic biosynthesis monooxygenase [Noviherbaspirillum sp. CPCC 100848]|uniref:Antibiotic biosynthesis monooxygenase n=1 Tax=Noviherbaspirillum album TaxID=3080276 RepID=A0ABU6J4N1_9BURK|nr:antibiotic biosynthesis monooxygenase [Noviherbaspirillum sp. CPCC 100848]MEC4718345.1 antibiotic biosynthesis monooxygenase [Noviherbaspirillum sp. CPCC 100848]
MISGNERAASLVIRHEVRPTDKDDYEMWLKSIATEAQRFAGHMGVNIIRPHNSTGSYTIVLRFDSDERLDSWLQSDTRKRFINEIRPTLVNGEELEMHTGLEYWFTPPAEHRLQARPFKQFLITLSAIFPLTVVLPWVLHPVFDYVPLLGRPIINNFILAVVIVYLMVYVIMPRYTRLVSRWLFQ